MDKTAKVKPTDTEKMITIPKCIYEMLWLIARGQGYKPVKEVDNG